MVKDVIGRGMVHPIHQMTKLKSFSEMLIVFFDLLLFNNKESKLLTKKRTTMKRARQFFAITLILVVANVQYALAGGVSNFLSNNGYDFFKTVSLVAHPGNNFQRATYNVDGDCIHATIYSTGKWSGWSYTMKVNIYKSGYKFNYLEVVDDNDIATAFEAANRAKGIINDLFQYNHSELLSFAENMYGERLYDMNAKRMCLACLSFMYWLN